MQSTTTKHLYWEIKMNSIVYYVDLYSGYGEEPTYQSDSLLDDYGIYDTHDANLIFEDIVNTFGMPDKYKQHLLKLLTDFSIEDFLNNEQDPEFLGFLQYYDFCIKVCVNKQYL